MADLDPNVELAAKGVKALQPGNPASDAILHLLAHMAYSDGVLHDGEMSFLQTLLPNRDRAALETWVADIGAQPPLLDKVAEVVTEPDTKWTCLRFAARMAWKDGELQDEEREFLDTLATSIGLGQQAVDRVLAEMEPVTDGYSVERVIGVLKSVKWDAVQLASGELVSPDLVAVSPPNSELVCRIGLERVEVMALYPEGLVARFLEGPALLKWSELVSYSKGFGLGASVTLLTESGMSFTLVDSRLTGLTLILDRLLGGDNERQASAPPTVEHVNKKD